MPRSSRSWVGVATTGALALTAVAATAEARGPYARRARVVATAATIHSANSADYPMLGTFYPGPYMTVRSESPIGGGYAPLNARGFQNMSLDGPLSALRVTSAPVVSYSRGYDGRVVTSEGTSFSYPYLPSTSPVVYPTRASYYYGFRQSGTPPWWDTGANWVDQR